MTPMESILPQLHATLAFVSFTGFLLRAWWTLWREKPLARLWRRTLPDLLDTLLLTTGLLLFFTRGHSLAEGWLALKLVAVVGYIALGFAALRLRSQAAFFAACLCFAIVVALAIIRPSFLS